MKATGIVRRIDNLGRVVIPIELRRNMRMNEGAQLEIFTSGNQVIFQKYSIIESMAAIVKDMLEALYRTHKTPVIACDKDKVIAANGISKEQIVSRRITSDLEEIMEQRKIYAHNADNGTFCFPVEGVNQYAIVCAPVITSGDTVGSILYLSMDSAPVPSASDTQIELVQAFATYLGKQLGD